jgi:hypothetical protein
MVQPAVLMEAAGMVISPPPLSQGTNILTPKSLLRPRGFIGKGTGVGVVSALKFPPGAEAAAVALAAVSAARAIRVRKGGSPGNGES